MRTYLMSTTRWQTLNLGVTFLHVWNEITTLAQNPCRLHLPLDLCLIKLQHTCERVISLCLSDSKCTLKSSTKCNCPWRCSCTDKHLKRFYSKGSGLYKRPWMRSISLTSITYYMYRTQAVRQAHGSRQWSSQILKRLSSMRRACARVTHTLALRCVGRCLKDGV